MECPIVSSLTHWLLKVTGAAGFAFFCLISTVTLGKGEALKVYRIEITEIKREICYNHKHELQLGKKWA